MIVVKKVDLWPHCVTTTYNNLDLNFVVDIPTKNTINKLNLSTTTSTATQKATSLMTTGLEFKMFVNSNTPENYLEAFASKTVHAWIYKIHFARKNG